MVHIFTFCFSIFLNIFFNHIALETLNIYLCFIQASIFDVV